MNFFSSPSSPALLLFMQTLSSSFSSITLGTTQCGLLCSLQHWIPHRCPQRPLTTCQSITVSLVPTMSQCSISWHEHLHDSALASTKAICWKTLRKEGWTGMGDESKSQLDCQHMLCAFGGISHWMLWPSFCISLMPWGVRQRFCTNPRGRLVERQPSGWPTSKLKRKG